MISDFPVKGYRGVFTTVVLASGEHVIILSDTVEAVQKVVEPLIKDRAAFDPMSVQHGIIVAANTFDSK